MRIHDRQSQLVGRTTAATLYSGLLYWQRISRLRREPVRNRKAVPVASPEIVALIPDARGKRSFEIGCAHGFFLEMARNTFLSVEGIDISDDAIAYARHHLGLEARSADFLTHQFAVQPDLICLWDTVEHLSRPDLYLQKMADSLSPGGLLALTTGDLDSCWLAPEDADGVRSIPRLICITSPAKPSAVYSFDTGST